MSSALCLSALAEEPGSQMEQSLAAATHLADVAARTLHLFVTEARRDGKTWAAIGDELGISRQAVQKRFDGQVPQKVTRRLPDAPPELVELAVQLLDDAAAGRFATIEERASTHLLRLGGAAGLAPAFSAVTTIYGELLSREEAEPRMIGRVLYVQALEQRTLKPTRAEVTLSLDGTLLGLNYVDVDAT